MKDSALIPILLTLVVVFFIILLYLNGVFGMIDTTEKERFAPADPCGADNLTPIPVSCVSQILTDLYQKQAPPPAQKQALKPSSPALPPSPPMPPRR